MNLEEMILEYRHLTNQMKELEARKKELSLTILSQMDKMAVVENIVAKRFRRLTFKTTLEEAPPFMQQKLKKLSIKTNSKSFISPDKLCRAYLKLST